MNDWLLYQGKGSSLFDLSEDDKSGLDEQELIQLLEQKKYDLRNKIKAIEAPPWRQFGKVKDIAVQNLSNLESLEKVSITDKSLKELAEEEDLKTFQDLCSLAKSKTRQLKKGKNFRLSDSDDAQTVRNAVNAAIFLRRPLLITGNPGSGKTSLAYSIAQELNLGSVLLWSVNARSTLQEGLYRYDAIARLQDANKRNNDNGDGKDRTDEKPIGKYIKLGALGTAFLPSFLPRVLLIDEIDKCDITLPNDLLNIFEEGQFEIPELVRRVDKDKQSIRDNFFEVQTQDEERDVWIQGGRVRCFAFPIIIMTSNGERDFPQAFKRRCLRVRMPDPNDEELESIVRSHFGDQLFDENKDTILDLIDEFLPEDTKSSRDKATDQLLNAIYIITHDANTQNEEQKEAISKLLMRSLSEID